FNENIKLLEQRLGIDIAYRDNHFTLTGPQKIILAAVNILKNLYIETAPVNNHYSELTPEQIHLAIKEAGILEQVAASTPDYGKAIHIKTKRGVIKPRTPNQSRYIANIFTYDITFGIGPAVTCKTYLA